MNNRWRSHISFIFSELCRSSLQNVHWKMHVVTSACSNSPQNIKLSQSLECRNGPVTAALGHFQEDIDIWHDSCRERLVADLIPIWEPHPHPQKPEKRRCGYVLRPNRGRPWNKPVPSGYPPIIAMILEDFGDSSWTCPSIPQVKWCKHQELLSFR